MPEELTTASREIAWQAEYSTWGNTLTEPNSEFLDVVSAIAMRILGPDGEAGFMEFFFG